MISEVDLRDWGDVPSKPIESKEQYQHYLSRMDWTYEFSDDHRVFMQGIRALRYLTEAAPHFDPQFILWDQYRGKV